MLPETIFLDRDGVINRRLPDDYVRDWSQFEFLPGVIEALRLFTEAGARLFIVTNQRGIARGLMTEQDLAAVHQQMLSQIEAAGARIQAIYYCPHDRGQCSCRKPLPGMFFQARAEYLDLRLNQSLMIGDSLSDMEAGAAAGCRTFLITDHRVDDSDPDLVTDGTAPSLYEAARHYLRF